jgi:hypothetical protein
VKGSGQGLIFGYHPSICQEGLKKPQETSCRIVGVLTEIRTEHFPIKSETLESELNCLVSVIHEDWNVNHPMDMNSIVGTVLLNK